mgnify:FL=1
MKVLSIKEPWATLIASKQKYIETRSWKTSYRGELYIHASKKQINNKDEKIQELLKLLPTQEMNYGKIICKCELVDCIYMDEKFINEIKQNKQEYICGDYQVGRYAWILEKTELMQPKIDAKGKLNIWNFEITQ